MVVGEGGNLGMGALFHQGVEMVAVFFYQGRVGAVFSRGWGWEVFFIRGWGCWLFSSERWGLIFDFFYQG